MGFLFYCFHKFPTCHETAVMEHVKLRLNFNEPTKRNKYHFVQKKANKNIQISTLTRH
jgi:hypothetical protein